MIGRKEESKKECKGRRKGKVQVEAKNLIYYNIDRCNKD
jgi:hypothetical protein